MKESFTLHSSPDQDGAPQFVTGAELIAAERKRQEAVEGWSPDHDDEHDRDQLARAAACYAIPAPMRHVVSRDPVWPWDRRFWKPTPNDRVRELVKAGALIAAEIDRLQRASS